MNDQKRLDGISKFLSLVLRHSPEKIGLNLNEQGWAAISQLIENSANFGKRFSRDDLQMVVATSDKQRFRISDDGTSIRANQGHSVSDVDLGLDFAEPPETLYHGTAERFLGSIKEFGLRSGSRNHVHLSFERDTAEMVGRRHGSPVVLRVNAAAMYHDGYKFHISDNGVWLTNVVPVLYINFYNEKIV